MPALNHQNSKAKGVGLARLSRTILLVQDAPLLILVPALETSDAAGDIQPPLKDRGLRC